MFLTRFYGRLAINLLRQITIYLIRQKSRKQKTEGGGTNSFSFVPKKEWRIN